MYSNLNKLPSGSPRSKSSAASLENGPQYQPHYCLYNPANVSVSLFY